MSTINTSVRPTKKQRELLSFIEVFIGEHGYSPSYREIMSGLQYTSVATVALHVTSLIKRGHLRKRDRSARSLEVVDTNVNAVMESTADKADSTSGEEKWLIHKIEHMFSALEQANEVTAIALEELSTLVGALKVLGLHTAAGNFMPRLTALYARGLPPIT